MGLITSLRPKSFEEFYGNKRTVEAIKDILKRKDKPHAYLFQGDSGCGKTTMARILASELKAERGDIVELNAANMRGIDTTREIVRTSSFVPQFSVSKIYIMDECQQLTRAAQEALLKVLEDSPEYCYFVFCSTQPERLIGTLKNRCSVFDFLPLRPPDMESFIRDSYFRVKGEEIDKEVLVKIKLVSDGCPRTALKCIERIMNMDDFDEIREELEVGTVVDKSVLNLCKKIVSRKLDRWKECLEAFNNLEVIDVNEVRASILSYLSTYLLKSKNIDDAIRFSDMIRCFDYVDYQNKKAYLIRAIFEASLIKSDIENGEE